MRRRRMVVVTVRYGQECPSNITAPILRIVLRHLKIDAALCYTNDAPTKFLGQATTSCEHGR